MNKSADIKTGTAYAARGYTLNGIVYGLWMTCRKVTVTGAPISKTPITYSGRLHNGAQVKVKLMDILMTWDEWKAQVAKKRQAETDITRLYDLIDSASLPAEERKQVVMLTEDELAYVVSALSEHAAHKVASETRDDLLASIQRESDR